MNLKYGKDTRGIFENCISLTSVTIPNSVSSIGGRTFRGCTNLTSITIPNSVTSIESQAFMECTNLTSITIPNSVTSIGNSAFYECEKLVSITMPNSVTNIEVSAFKNTGYYNDSNNWEQEVLYIGNYVIEAEKTISGEYILKNGTRGIATSAFNNCKNVTKITIPNSVTNIGENAFNGCTGLTSVTIPSSVTSIGSKAFYRFGGTGCKIYCETQAVADLLIAGTHYNKSNMEVVVDPSKF